MVVAFDLDDTLFSEVDFLKSAQQSIATTLAAKYGFNPIELLGLIQGPGNVFDKMERWLRQNVATATEDAPWMVQYYRSHHPNDLSLSKVVTDTLDQLKNSGHSMALVTDGRSGTQRSKIDALKLNRWFTPEMIYISDEIGADKVDGKAFRDITEIFPAESKIYIGDNPAKDFVWPNRLGWHTVMLSDSGCNIHSQSDIPSAAHQPQFIITEFSQIIDIINGIRE